MRNYKRAIVHKEFDDDLRFIIQKAEKNLPPVFKTRKIILTKRILDYFKADPKALQSLFEPFNKRPGKKR